MAIKISGSAPQPTIQEEGVDLPIRSKLNIAGAGASAVDDAANNRTVITVNTGAAGGHVIKDEGTSRAARTNLNFLGLGVSATDNAGADSTDIRVVRDAPINVMDYPYSAVNTDTGDQTAAINAAIAVARTSIAGTSCGEVFFPRGVYKCTTMTDGTNVIDAEKVVLRGETIGGSRISIPTDHGAGKYGINFQKTDTATTAYIGLRNLSVYGPQVSGDYGEAGTGAVMEGVRVGNRIFCDGFDIRGFHSGFYMFKDHEIIKNGSVTSNFYNIYFNNTTSGGDQKFEGVTMNAPLKAVVGISEAAAVGGATFRSCQMGDCSFVFYKEGTTPTNTSGITSSIFEGCSFESFGHAIFYSEVYQPAVMNVGCDGLVFIRCFVSGAHDTTRLIPVAHGDGNTYTHGQTDNINSGYPQDAPFMGARISGLTMIGSNQPFYVPSQPGRADKSYLAAGLGAIEGVELEDLKTWVDGLGSNLVGATPTRKLFHFAGSGACNDVKFTYGGARATIRQAAATFSATELLEYNSAGDKVQRATGNLPLAGVAIETATTTVDRPAFVYSTEPHGNPIPVAVDQTNSAALSAAQKWIKPDLTNNGCVQAAVNGAGTGTITSAATSATITHGLGATPLASEISIVWTEDPTTDPLVSWISGITSTQFVVNVGAAPGASNLDFSWRAQSRNIIGWTTAAAADTSGTVDTTVNVRLKGI